MGDGQQGAVAAGGVVEECGAVAGAGVEVGEAFAVFAAEGGVGEAAGSPGAVGRRVGLGGAAEDDARGAPFGEEAGGATIGRPVRCETRVAVCRARGMGLVTIAEMSSGRGKERCTCSRPS